MERFKSMIKGDKTIWFFVFLLAGVGILEVYSCTSMIAYKFQGGDTFHYPLRHIAYIFMGFIMMCLFSWIPYKKYAKWADGLLWACVALLFLTLITGHATNDAKRWFTIPLIGLSFQTSDFAKIALVVYLSKMLALAQVEPENRWKCFTKCIFSIVAVCGLVLPANFSTALLIGVASLGMLILGNFPRKWILGLIGLAIVGFIMFVLVVKVTGVSSRFDTWTSRIETFFTGGGFNRDFQSEQSLVAIGLGGINGAGIGSGIQNNSLPHPYSDFMFSTIAHEIGVWGVIGIMICYLVVFYRCVQIVKHAGTLFPALLVMGFLTNIVLQTLVNMYVAIGFMPVTGQPLPFVSMGGSSIVSTGIAIGVILNISRYSTQNETVSEIEQDEEEMEEIVDYPFMVG
ncbi:MAG: FtsW/RodA/SpoVE family cell cycle protein [Bacteroidales bacterium]|nr:FtsW/RodA/SpoVE family cell cycle protein [Bacteroidales bacterium]MBR2201415.1 FtsW/RodA/SpoVE family cell cycle protein [Bacteroidales bacterium]